MCINYTRCAKNPEHTSEKYIKIRQADVTDKKTVLQSNGTHVIFDAA